MLLATAGFGTKRAVVVTVATVLASAGLVSYANADPGIDKIGPGPSDNTPGVECVQQALNRAIRGGELKGLPNVKILSVDGKYGQDVYTDVKRFQQAKNLFPVDGAVGPETGDKLVAYAPEGCVAKIPTYGVSSPSSHGQSAAPIPTHKPSGGFPISINCGIATCSAYLSRSATETLDELVEGSGPPGEEAGTAACEKLAEAVVEAAPVMFTACMANFILIKKELSDATNKSKHPNGACLKVTFTKPAPGVPPTITWWSTNTGTYCKE